MIEKMICTKKIAGEFEGKPYEGYRVVTEVFASETDDTPVYLRMYKAKGDIGERAAEILAPSKLELYKMVLHS